MRIGLSMGIGARRLQLAASIKSLFAAGEQGVWYDPSDLSTLYQDAAGTTPVTAVEQPVGRMLDKSGRGNHATQTTSTSRPVLSARYNLLTKTEQFDDAAWGKVVASVTPNAVAAPDGTMTADKLVAVAILGQHRLEIAAPVVAGVSYSLSVYAKAGEYSNIWLRAAGDVANAVFNLATGGITETSAGTASITDVGGGWYLCRVTGVAAATGNAVNRINVGSTYAGDGTSGIYIWGASLVPANQANLPYQRVNTATDYDADPAKFPAYLKFDGVDDGMVTNSIDFTATDKMTVFAGVRKLVSATGVITELSSGNSLTSGLGTPGIFGVFAGPDPTYIFGLRGSNPYCRADSSSYTAPGTSVLQVSLNIGQSFRTEELVPRINGVYPTSVHSGNTSAGDGNFGNYPLYIGRRGGTTLPFNGHLYGLIVRGAATTDTRIAQTERWVNKKTGAY